MTSFSFSFSNPRHANFKEEPRQRIAELLGSKRSGKLFIPSATLKDGRSERNQKSARVLRGIPAALPRRLNIMHSGFDRSRTDFYQQKKKYRKKEGRLHVLSGWLLKISFEIAFNVRGLCLRISFQILRFRTRTYSVCEILYVHICVCIICINFIYIDIYIYVYMYVYMHIYSIIYIRVVAEVCNERRTYFARKCPQDKGREKQL